VIARGASLSSSTSGKVCISEQVWLQHVEFITNPTNHTKMLGGMDVTDKAMKLSVTFGRPFRDKSREVTDRAQQVKTT
jgi:hypothetical protein